MPWSRKKAKGEESIAETEAKQLGGCEGSRYPIKKKGTPLWAGRGCLLLRHQRRRGRNDLSQPQKKILCARFGIVCIDFSLREKKGKED